MKTLYSFKCRKSLLPAFFLLLLFSVQGNAQTYDTIHAKNSLKPFEIPDDFEYYSSLHNAQKAGDVNGDGKEDFIFRIDGQADGKTQILVTEPGNAVLLPDEQLCGIGDFNNDGYDDLFDAKNWTVYMGGSHPENMTTYQIQNTDSTKVFVKAFDMDNDGATEIIFAKTNHYYNLFAFNYNDTSYITINTFEMLIPMPENVKFDLSDYDNDGNKEFFILYNDIFEERFVYGWFKPDETGEYNRVFWRKINYTNSIHFVFALSDIDGDGKKDICHAFYDTHDYDNKSFNLEVHFANDSLGYFSPDADTVEAHVNNVLFYPAGDINGDGYDDWISKNSIDTLYVFYGRDNIQTDGFNIVKYPLPENAFFQLTGNGGTWFSEESIIPLDYNRDGYNDVKMDFWQWDDHHRYTTIGTAIFVGGETPDFTSPVHFAKAPAPYYQGFGTVVKNAGDMNNDGYEDWAILSRSNNKVSIYYGSAVLDYNPDLTILLPQDYGLYAYDMAFGDLNNDGRTDMVVSNATASDITFGWGKDISPMHAKVYVFLGKDFDTDTLYAADADYLLTAPDETVRYPLGKSLNIVGDYNNDGYNDIVMKSSMPRHALIYYGGNPVSTVPDQVITVYSTSFSSEFAVPVSACGDINGDGYPDFTLADPSNGTGKSFIFTGGPQADNEYDYEITNYDTSNLARYFSPVTSDISGDFNGDSHNDLVYYNYQLKKLFVFLGGSGFDSEPDIQLNDTSGIYGYNNYIQYINDFSKKGQADLLIPSKDNLMYLFYGCSTDKTGADVVFTYPSDITAGITSVASGDFNKNGYVDILAGHPGQKINGVITGGVVTHYVSHVQTDVDEHSRQPLAELALAPNPATTRVRILYKTPDKGKIELLITDLNGKNIYRSQSNERSFDVDISTFPKGIYLITVTDSQTRSVKKLITF